MSGIYSLSSLLNVAYLAVLAELLAHLPPSPVSLPAIPNFGRVFSGRRQGTRTRCCFLTPDLSRNSQIYAVRTLTAALFRGLANMASLQDNCLIRRLPSHILQHVFSFLPPPTLKKCRLLSREGESLANRWAFFHIRLTAVGCDARRFIRVASSPKLRKCVREVTCDLWTGPGFQYMYAGDSSDRIPKLFLEALPLLRFFSLVRVVHLRFNAPCEPTLDNGYILYSIPADETQDLRYRVMDTVFRCIAGTWTAEEQTRIDKSLCLEIDASRDDAADTTEPHAVPCPWPTDESLPSLPVTGITVSNLSNIEDNRLTTSDAFNSVLSSGRIVDLRIRIDKESEVAWPRNPHERDFLSIISRAWLLPTMAENLRVLSLYAPDQWTWNPDADYRDANPPAGIFPNLKVLALGHFAFGPEWQVDWVASLGRKHGNGGLEELYLDHCSVMDYTGDYKASEPTAAALASNTEQPDIFGSGQSIEDSTATQRHDSTSTRVFRPLRWHMVLRQWQAEMIALKVFKMGRGARDEALDLVVAANVEETPPPGTVTYGSIDDWEAATQPFRDNDFRYFDCPTPPEEIKTLDYDTKWRFGAGMLSKLEPGQSRLPYIHPWTTIGTGTGECNFVNSSLVEAEVTARDEEALTLLIETIQRRRCGKLHVGT